MRCPVDPEKEKGKKELRKLFRVGDGRNVSHVSAEVYMMEKIL
jgi:hypothetical protein